MYFRGNTVDTNVRCHCCSSFARLAKSISFEMPCSNCKQWVSYEWISWHRFDLAECEDLEWTRQFKCTQFDGLWWFFYCTACKHADPRLKGGISTQMVAQALTVTVIVMPQLSGKSNSQQRGFLSQTTSINALRTIISMDIR